MLDEQQKGEVSYKGKAWCQTLPAGFQGKKTAGGPWLSSAGTRLVKPQKRKFSPNGENVKEK